MHRRDHQRPLVGLLHAARAHYQRVSHLEPKEEEHPPERRNSFRNRRDPLPRRKASWPSPGASTRQALLQRLSFCRGKELRVRNQRNLDPERGSIPSEEPFAALCSRQSPDPTAASENRENALETDFRTLQVLDSRGSIRESLGRHFFPRPGKILGPHPSAGTSFPVLLSVLVEQRESLDSGRHTTLDAPGFASTDPTPKQLRNQLRTLARSHPAWHTPAAVWFQAGTREYK